MFTSKINPLKFSSLLVRNRKFLSKRIQTVGIVGSGQMGTVIFDSQQKQLYKSKEFIDGLLDKEIKKGILKAEEKSQIQKNFSLTDNLETFKNADFIVEAVTENLNVKQDLFSKLDSITRPETILASNTSSISITKIASFTKKPNKVIGMHFMNPVPVMKLVEVIRGLQTDDETFNTTLELVKNLQKDYSVSRDIPGFIANRILMPYINEAIFTLYEGIGTVEDIDKTMKLGTNVPMGPLTLADFIGLDTVLYILQVLFNDLKDPKYRPCPLLVNYVNAGWLGKKSGRGFYNYKEKI